MAEPTTAEERAHWAVRFGAYPQMRRLIDDVERLEGEKAALREPLKPITRLDDRPLSIMEAREFARDAANALKDTELAEALG